jgi:hypothetical protein
VTELLIRSYDRAAEMLTYSTERGPLREGAYPAGAKRDRGFYTSLVGAHYGIYASTDGPVAFRGRTQWLLRHSGTRTEFEKLPDGQVRVALVVDGEVAFDVTHTPDSPVVDNWSDDESTKDFFSWLHSSVTTDPENFFRYYTVEA